MTLLFVKVVCDHNLLCLQCSTMAVIYQKTSSTGKHYVSLKSRKLLVGTTYGELAANFITPEGWLPISDLVRCTPLLIHDNVPYPIYSYLQYWYEQSQVAAVWSHCRCSMPVLMAEADAGVS